MPRSRRGVAAALTLGRKIIEDRTPNLMSTSPDQASRLKDRFKTEFIAAAVILGAIPLTCALAIATRSLVVFLGWLLIPMTWIVLAVDLRRIRKRLIELGEIRDAEAE